MTDPKIEATEKLLTVKVEFPQDKIAEALETSVRTTLFTGAVNYVLSQMTPELTAKLIQTILHDAFKHFSTWELQKQVTEMAIPILKEVLGRPEVYSEIRKRTEEGVMAAIGTLPTTVKEKLIEQAVKGMTASWRDR